MVLEFHKNACRRTFFEIRCGLIILTTTPNSINTMITILVYSRFFRVLLVTSVIISPTLLPALIHIINKSLLTDIFPTTFKQARATPLLKNCSLQKLIPTHQFLFCWVYQLLLTLLIIRFSCPAFHHWTSLGLHFAGLNPISLAGLSGWPGKGRYPKHINRSLGFLRDRFLDHSSSPYTPHHWVPSYKHMASHTIVMLMTHSSISHFNPTVAAWQTSWT